MITIDSALRELDAADPSADATTLRAQADLAHILHSDRRDGSLPSARRPRRRAIRVAVRTGAVAAAAAAVIVAAPSITGGDRAFASWTPTPTGLSPSQATAAGEQCRTTQLDGAGRDFVSQLSAAEPAVAERRGVWTTVVLAESGGFSALCITDGSRHLFHDMMGSVGAPANDTAPKPRAIKVTDLGTGTMRAGELSLVAGVAGADITGIAYRSASKGTVRATVAGGRFALWFPGDELEDAPRLGVELTLTFADGTTARTRARLGS